MNPQPTAMNRTLAIQIGNSDDKLPQVRWAEFVSEVNNMLRLESLSINVHFCGSSSGDSPWQNHAWVVECLENRHFGNMATPIEKVVDRIKDNLRLIAKKFNQDSVALTDGQTEMIKP